MRIAIALLALLTACSVPKPFDLPAASVADRLGPQPGTDLWPRVFVAGMVSDDALAELAPYRGVTLDISGAADVERCGREAALRLVETRPDAFLVVHRTRPPGARDTPFSAAWLPGNAPIADGVGYAMRALPARLPFRYTLSSGMVMDVLDRAAAADLKEGDALVGIAGAPAIPPRDWPTWSLYERLLASEPGTEIELEWIRPGTGKMAGKARLLPPAAPHLTVVDSIDVRYMPLVHEREHKGKPYWSMPSAGVPHHWSSTNFWGEPRRRDLKQP